MKNDATKWTIAYFRDLYRGGKLNLKKPYQRKPVWVERQKCALIETILMDMPIPEVFVEVSTSKQGEQEFGVVDGQQRLRAIMQFMGNESDPREEEYNAFALDKVGQNSRWKSYTFEDLRPEDKTRFWNTFLAVRILTPEAEGEVEEMFRRLNKYLTPLNAQELRNATYSGPFAAMSIGLANDEYWAENRIVTPLQIRRMNDVEFVSELLIGVLHGPQGGSGKVIDDYYFQYEDYDDEFPGQPDAERLFLQTRELIARALPDLKDTRWKNKTDFYTLFVAAATLLRSQALESGARDAFRGSLDEFAGQVDVRLADEYAKVSKPAVSYVRAHEKRANAKNNRAARQAALLTVIKQFFG